MNFVKRGDIFVELKNYKDAYHDYSMALDYSFMDADVLFKRGHISYQMNDKKRACADWKDAMRHKHQGAERKWIKYCSEEILPVTE